MFTSTLWYDDENMMFLAGQIGPQNNARKPAIVCIKQCFLNIVNSLVAIQCKHKSLENHLCERM